MKRFVTIFLSCLLFSIIVNAQSGSCADCKRFESPKMYVEKSADRIISIEATLFEAKINGQKNWNARIEIRSYDKKINYFQSKGSGGYSITNPDYVRLIPDNSKINSQAVFYDNLRERIVNGERKGFIGFRPVIKDEKVLDEKGLEVSGMLLETITLSYDPNEFKKLENAQKLTLKIYKRAYKLSEEQVREIVSIAQKITSNKL